MSFKAPGAYMVEHPVLGMGEGNNGFFILVRERGRPLYCVSSDGAEWEHVSVSTKYPSKVPSWEDMCYIKNIFWDDEDCIVQYHPRKSDYVNNAKNCLHLWRPTTIKLPEPHYSLVGIK